MFNPEIMGHLVGLGGGDAVEAGGSPRGPSPPQSKPSQSVSQSVEGSAAVDSERGGGGAAGHAAAARGTHGGGGATEAVHCKK